ncbi:heparinase II/III domain-containing protein [Paenibacillus flagellatus]|uniref:Heparinase n=1 Tax=Paenibacillus flagellatus TaxID=2211139 RepID=A0A2V5K888_9BACL|nr:heparinase II/III family protein [Paenibacillus flagellatus]PYI55709.1 heparinase [Paenibacillus flagellatus]
MLAERGTIEQLRKRLVPAGEYRPFARGDEREAWEALPLEAKRELVRGGEERLPFAWPALPAARYMDYVRNGNRSVYENAYFERRRALLQLVMAECAEYEGRFSEQIVNGIWAICEESSWVVPAHMSLSRKGFGDGLPDITDPVIDLFAAETASLLAWTVYLLGTRLDGCSGVVRDRVKLEVGRRIHTPYLERDDFWWMGLKPGRKVNNWNPWVNASCLSSFLLLEDDHDRRVRGVSKAMRSLDAFLAVYPEDGGCDEGPSYWSRAGGSLFDALEQLYGATNGEIDVYGEPLIREIGRYIYRVHVAGKSYINFADGDANVEIDAELAERFGRRIGDPQLSALGAAAISPDSLRPRYIVTLFRYAQTVLRYREVSEARAKPPLLRDVWTNGLQVMAARETEGSERGLFLAAKGGHNDESHNHNDIGHFIVYADGKPLLIDVGVETYTAKTFSASRYDIWTMRSEYHNVPVVNGYGQSAGGGFAAGRVAYRTGDGRSELEMELAGAYPEEAGIVSWIRSCTLQRGDRSRVEIADRYKLRHANGRIALHLMAADAPQLETNGVLLLGSGNERRRLSFDGERMGCTVERIAIGDEKLKRTWGEAVYRIALDVKAPELEGEWRIVVE